MIRKDVIAAQVFCFCVILMCISCTTVKHSFKIKDRYGKVHKSEVLVDPDPEAEWVSLLNMFPVTNPIDAESLDPCILKSKMFVNIWPSHDLTINAVRLGMYSCLLAQMDSDKDDYRKYEVVSLNMAYLKEAIELARTFKDGWLGDEDIVIERLSALAERGFYHQEAFPFLLKIIRESISKDQNGLFFTKEDYVKKELKRAKDLYKKWYEDNRINDLISAWEFKR